jgi:hypothetical protein
MMIVAVGFVVIVGVVGAVFGDIGKAIAVALGGIVFLVGGVVVALREARSKRQRR